MHTHICTNAQAAVFKNLYYNWQDDKNFISSYNEDEIDSAISNFESQIQQLQTEKLSSVVFHINSARVREIPVDKGVGLGQIEVECEQ